MGQGIWLHTPVNYVKVFCQLSDCNTVVFIKDMGAQLPCNFKLY